MILGAEPALTKPPLPPTSGPVPAGVTLRLLGDVALATIIARKGAERPLAEAVETAFGLMLPTGPKCAQAAGLTVIGVAPGQWLGVAEAHPDLADSLITKLGAFAAITDQSDSRAVLRISGAKARAALAKGLPIDLHPSRFGPGDSAVTVMAQVGVHLWQIDDQPSYTILVWRSLADDFVSLLLSNAAEYGVDISAFWGAAS